MGLTYDTKGCNLLLAAVVEQTIYDWDQLVLRGKTADPESGSRVCLANMLSRDVRDLKNFIQSPRFAQLLSIACPEVDPVAARDRILHRTPEEVLRNRRDARLREVYGPLYAWWKAGIRDVEELTERKMQFDDVSKHRRVRNDMREGKQRRVSRNMVIRAIRQFEKPLRMSSWSINRKHPEQTLVETSLTENHKHENQETENH
jgi:hypothetical protein